MPLTYGELKDKAAAAAADFAAARSARNLLSRRKAEEKEDERQAERGRRRRARKNERELEELLRRKVRIWVPKEERPRIGRTTARNLYHRAAGMLLGATGLTDARGPDGLYSIHFAFTARGLASTKGRRWRRGEAERAARYIVREEGLERGELGWWSNIAADRNELIAFYRTVEALERHDRSNANVYISEVIALPAELSARQRRRAVRRICRFFEARGLPYTVAIHTPDASGDQRNYHCHIIYSLRPCERVAPYEWSFGVAKEDDINTPDGIVARRIAVVRAINTTLSATGLAKRYTHLSNKARRMAAAQPKLGQQRTWAARRLEALEVKVATLQRLETSLRIVIGQLSGLAPRLQQVRSQVQERFEALARSTKPRAKSSTRLDHCHTRAGIRLERETLVQTMNGTGRRLRSVRFSAAIALQGFSATLVASERIARMRRMSGKIAEQLSRTRLVADGAHAAAEARLLQSHMTVKRQLEVGSSQLALLRAAFAPRLGRISDRASKYEGLQARTAALGSAISGSNLRVSHAGKAATASLVSLAGLVAARSNQNKQARIRLAGMGAVARLREERLNRRTQSEMIRNRLQSHKVLLDQRRVRAADLAGGLGEAVMARLGVVQTRLANIGRSPGLQRLKRLEAMSTELHPARGSPVRLDAMREGAHARLVGTANEISWALRGKGAALASIGTVAERRHRLSILTGHVAIIDRTVTTKRATVQSVHKTVAEVIDARIAALASRLADQSSRLGQTRANMQQLNRAAVDRSNEGSAGNSAGEGRALPESRPAASPLGRARARPGSATETLRKLLPTRTPETELHSSVLPQADRGPLPPERTSRIRDMLKHLRWRVAEREPDVQSELCERALQRLRTSQAIIRQGPEGTYIADDRGLFADERQVLRSAAQIFRVQPALAELWQAQENRRQAAATPAATAAAVPQSMQSDGVDPDVQSRFLANRFGQGR